MNKLPLLAVLLLVALHCRAEEALPLLKSGEHYQLRARSEAVGAGKGKLLLEIAITDGWKFNLKAPLLLKISALRGAKLEKTSWLAKDASRLDEHLCRFEIPYSAQAKASLEMKFDFVVCTDILCQKKKFSLTYEIGG